MSLKERLDADMKTAMKAREAGKVRLGVLRMAKSAIKYAEIAQGRELDDDGVAVVLGKELKQRQDSLVEFEKAGRAEQVAALREEMAILKEYMPEQLEGEALEALVREVIAQVGATGPQEMGKVMSALMPRVKGRADGRQVNETVRRFLST